MIAEANRNSIQCQINVSDPKNTFDRIPVELRQIPHWVLMKKGVRDNGETTKIPLNPLNLSKAQTNNPKTWTSFETAVDAYHASDEVDGIGFVFTEGTGCIAIDFDHAVTETGGISKDIEAVLSLCNSYSELSQSGTGIHIIVKGCILDGWSNRTTLNGIGIEAYDHGRYFVFTGDHIATTPLTINPVTEEALQWLGSRLKRKDATPSSPSQPGPASPILDDHIIELCKAERGVLWSRLFDEGDLSDYDDDHSKADYAFCCIVAEQTHDPDQIDRVFRSSKLFRSKWDEKRVDSTYGRNTIQKAISDTPLIDSLTSVTSVEESQETDRPKPLMLRPNLEADNFVTQYMDVSSGRNSSYPEYHYANALTALSVASRRKICIETFTETIYPNLYQFCFGQTSTSMKSSAQKCMTEMLEEVFPFGKIPDEFSPQSLIEILSDEPVCYFIQDEASKFFNAVKKRPHMGEAHEIILSLYDNRPYRKKLVTKRGKNAERSEFVIREPFLNLNFISTIEATSKAVDDEEFTSGLFPRFLTYHPTYKKTRKPLGEVTDEKKEGVADLYRRYSELASIIADHPPVRFRLSESGWGIYNLWADQKYENLSKHHDEMAASTFSRYSIIALKIAELLTLGSQDFVDWAKEEKDSTEFYIPDEYVTEVIRLMDEYFIPVALSVHERITELKSNNLGAKIKRLLKEKGEMARPDLVRHCNLYRENKNTWHFDNAIQTLLESQEVLERKEEGKPKYRLNLKYA